VSRSDLPKGLRNPTSRYYASITPTNATITSPDNQDYLAFEPLRSEFSEVEQDRIFHIVDLLNGELEELNEKAT